MKTLKDLLAEYVAHLHAINSATSRLYHERRAIENLLLWWAVTFDVVRPDQLREHHVRAWWDYLVQRRTTKGYPLKPRTRNRMIAEARRFLRYLGQRHYVAATLFDVLEYVRTVRLLPGSVLTHAQVKKLFRKVNTQTASGYRDRTVLEFLYTTAIRVGELQDLDLVDVDLDRAIAKVMGKGRKERIVPIGRTALRYLETYIKAIRGGLLKDRREPALFVGDHGARMRDYTVRRILHGYAARAGLDVTVTPHTFRRSCTTELIKGGANLYHVKELLGHEKIETLAPYTRLTILDLQKTHAKCHPREQEER